MSSTDATEKSSVNECIASIEMQENNSLNIKLIKEDNDLAEFYVSRYKMNNEFIQLIDFFF